MQPVPPTITLQTCTGEAITPLIPALAKLRVSVFRAWPYLYDGDPAYEADYLQTYQRSPGAAVIAALHQGEVIGASTCLPLLAETANIQAPFLAAGLNPAQFFYFGESVLLPQYRGLGIGVAFFQAREAHAATHAHIHTTCFCAVQRPENHPMRPPNHTPLDAFWAHRGYTKRPDLQCRIAWKDIGAPTETEKPLIFWLKPLKSPAQSPSPAYGRGKGPAAQRWEG